MGYSKNIHAKAKNIMLERHNTALRNAEKEKSIFYSKYPKAQDIEYQLTQTALRAGKAVVSGGDVKEELEKLKSSNQGLQLELTEIYKKAGVTEKNLEPKFHCVKCNDTGYIDGRICNCYKELLRETAYNQLNASSPLSLSTFDTFNLDYYPDEPVGSSYISPRKRMEQVFNFCKKYAANFSKDAKSLLMRGTTGLGKTHLSLAIATAVINKGFGVIYCSTPNIVSKLEKEHFSRFKSDDQTTEDLLIECDLLILDDLGTEFITQFTTSAIYNILNTRIMQGQPTIINTNMDISQLERTYSQRFVSRIIGDSLKLDFMGNDIRQIKAMRR